ncbi:O-antigen ligase family protein [Halorubrum tibetense]|uniref:O-antigen ligase family protein n=1 Tax=Halorubrum tibetense TaxID=175631 RepID=A0ABD5S9G2_9EURY
MNPNPLGELLFIGAVSSLVWVRRPYLKHGLFSVCVLGLFFAQSRAALLGFAAAIAVYLIGSAITREQFTQFILVSIAAGTTGYLMLLRLIPGPTIIEQVYLSGRLEIWYAAIDAIKAQPVFGHGPGDMPTIVGEFTSAAVGAGIYNSFLRLFVTTGIIGGLCYLYIFLYSIVSHTKVIASRESLIVHALVIGFVVNELFSGNSIFGLSTTSVVGALLIGYLLRDIIENRSDTTSTTA